MKQKLFSVTLDDCEVQTFTVGGHGGAGKDTSNTGVRIIHHPSGAIGKATDSRSQIGNKRLAFARMARTAVFQNWCRLKAQDTPVNINKFVEEWMRPENLKVEYYIEGKWTLL